ncbi:MAG: hypothetical protein HYY04_02540, partial [Chloroflexi bacterium]|nr:hypothetical protein [Chloroflexota bacterium]
RDERSDLFTALLAGLLLAVPPRSLRVLVVGGLTSDQPLTWVADTPHALANPATTTPEAVALIGRLEREVARRHGDAATRRRGDTATPDDARSPSENPTIVGVIEDVGVLLPSERAIVEPALEHVVSFGPTVGVHLLLAAADATPRALTGLLAAQLRSRITFRTEAAARSDRARSAIGEAGAELLLGSGDFLYCEAGGGDPSRRPCGFRNGPHFSKEALRRGQVPRVGERTLRGIGRRWPMDQTLADEPSHRWFAVTRRDTDPARAALTQQARALARQESGLTPRLIERRLQIGSALARSLWEELYAEGSLRT